MLSCGPASLRFFPPFLQLLCSKSRNSCQNLPWYLRRHDMVSRNRYWRNCLQVWIAGGSMDYLTANKVKEIPVNLARSNLPYPETVSEVRFFYQINAVPCVFLLELRRQNWSVSSHTSPGNSAPQQLGTRLHSSLRHSLLRMFFPISIPSSDRRDSLIEAHGSFATQ
ncbi:hypothetical protein GYMLUDRAFT_407375 [Collybiopsis luxurians FD-317 M1]|uniref:Uncharacterized protein n=1 Tax=Collybiopsis luxurians FD-317 M1 TaxID=944289 RepID=A0A0D0C0G0_9AGAR|nr:hypothetical protein GYMLUDRAFT_407375 [Collybiopsis luxurians FD-317 M1]